VEKELERLGGTHGLMIVASANQGAITSLSGKLKRCMLYLVGNPVIADKIIAIDIRAEAPANRRGFFCVRVLNRHAKPHSVLRKKWPQEARPEASCTQESGCG
jgi:hypothetical protein